MDVPNSQTARVNAAREVRAAVVGVLTGAGFIGSLLGLPLVQPQSSDQLLSGARAAAWGHVLPGEPMAAGSLSTAELPRLDMSGLSHTFSQLGQASVASGSRPEIENLPVQVPRIPYFGPVQPQVQRAGTSGLMMGGRLVQASTVQREALLGVTLDHQLHWTRALVGLGWEHSGASGVYLTGSDDASSITSSPERTSTQSLEQSLADHSTGAVNREYSHLISDVIASQGLVPARSAPLAAPALLDTILAASQPVSQSKVVPREARYSSGLKKSPARAPRKTLALAPAIPKASFKLSNARAAQGLLKPGKTWEQLLEGKKIWDTFSVTTQMPFLGEQVAGATARVFAAEGGHRLSTHAWVQVSGGYSVPTLQWVSRTDLSGQQLSALRVLSPNSMSLLGALKGASVDPDRGVVFGRVPAGYSVGLAGSAEQPLYLSTDGRDALDPWDNGQDRVFAFLNIQPGAAVVQLLDTHSQEPQGVVSAPVLSASATYLELTPPELRTLSIQVLDGTAKVARPISGAQLRVVGWKAPSVGSGKEGRAVLRSLPQVGTYPVYFEVTPREGYPHRYRVQADRSEVQAWVFSEGVVSQWLSQLEGGVHPDSGLLVGRVDPRGLGGGGAFSPQLESHTLDQAVQPEVYHWVRSDDDGAGELAVDTELDAQNSRFVGVQLMPGAHSVSILSGPASVANKVWSDWMISSPGVIQVVTGE